MYWYMKHDMGNEDCRFRVDTYVTDRVVRIIRVNTSGKFVAINNCMFIKKMMVSNSATCTEYLYNKEEGIVYGTI